MIDARIGDSEVLGAPGVLPDSAVKSEILAYSTNDGSRSIVGQTEQALNCKTSLYNNKSTSG